MVLSTSLGLLAVVLATVDPRVFHLLNTYVLSARHCYMCLGEQSPCSRGGYVLVRMRDHE